MRKTLCPLLALAFAFTANIHPLYFATDVGIRCFEYNVHDLWQHKYMGIFKQNLVAEIPPHDVLIVSTQQGEIIKNSPFHR